MVRANVLSRQLRKPRCPCGVEEMWWDFSGWNTCENRGSEGPKHGSFTAVAASHIDRLTCKPLHSCGGNQCSPPLRLKALFETTANGWSNFKRTQRQCHEKNRLAKSASPNCKLYSHTVTGALLGFMWKSVLPWQLHILSFKKKNWCWKRHWSLIKEQLGYL